MIEMTNVSKTFPNGTKALTNINVAIKQGEFIYIVGPSGAGKSTFIKMIYREEKPTEGTVIIKGRDISTYRDNRIPLLRRGIGVIFQDYKLLQNKTVFENVAFALEVTDMDMDMEKINVRVLNAIELVGLKEKIKCWPNELSGGEQQRVAIARSIVRNPEIVIADEPTGNLDPETTNEIIKIFEAINQMGTTIIMATHNKEIVNYNKHRLLEFEKGTIVRDEVGGNYEKKS